MKTFLALSLGLCLGFMGAGLMFQPIVDGKSLVAYECGFTDEESIILAGASGHPVAGDVVGCQEFRDRAVKAGFGQFSR